MGRMNSAPRNVLFIGPVFPEPTSSAAGVRTLSLLHDFRSRADRILFASPSDQNDFSAGLNLLGIETVKIGPNDPKFDRIVTEFKPDIAVFDRFILEEQFGWRVAAAAPHALRILDTIDLHFLRRVRGEWLKGAITQEGGPISDLDFTRISRSLEGIDTEDCLRETAAIYRSDLTLILSRFEEKLLREEFKIDESLLQWLGFSYPVADKAKWKAWTERRHFVSIGNFRHHPNRDSVFWLAQVLWPLMQKELRARGETDVELHLYGAYPPKEIMALDSPRTGFRVFGPAEESIPTLRNYRACLAPIRFGAGIKGKIADAWAAGIPVVTTPLGAEGMEIPIREQFTGMVAETERDFAEAAVELYFDYARSDALSQAGGEALSILYSEMNNRREFLARIEALLAPGALAEHRRKNLIGRILGNEAHGRTRYLSKWIEAKNRIPEGRLPEGIRS